MSRPVRKGAPTPRDAPLQDVLLRALGIDSDDPLEGILAGLRSEVAVAAHLAGEAGHVDAGNTLDSFARRLGAAIELRRRELSRAPKRKPKSK